MDDLLFSNVTLNEMKTNAKSLVESLLNRKLQESDPLILFLYSLLSIIYNQHALINENARQNLLAYARGANLDAMAELVGLTRKTAARAFCTAEITLSDSRGKTTIIPANTRFNAGDNVHFVFVEDIIFLSGEITKTARAICQTEGVIGNNYAAGEINKIVDYSPYLKTIVNITASEGGADIESDEDLRERIRQAPNSFSVAGARGAYEFWTKDFSNEIIDSYVTSPTPGIVDVYFLMQNGEIPNTEMLQGVYNHLSADNRRPLTDYVRVFAPEVVNYDINVSYYISIENKTRVTAIIEAVENAVDDFILWQKSKLGKDIEPSELIRLMRNAGADRIIINQPVFTEITPCAVAICQTCNVIYNGLKDI